MSITRPTGEQLTFKSAKTGDHVLDTYLESVERGTKTLSDLMDEIVDSSGNLKTSVFQFRETPIADGVRSGILQARAGTYLDANAGWANISSSNFATFVTDCQTALSSATTQANLATSNGAAQVALATTQAGLATTNGAAQVALATIQAGLATTNGAAQVPLATAQAVIATTKAGEAASSATAAANSATASANSASSIGSAETNSANSATAAAASFDSFDDRYLGAKSSNVAVDNDGNSLITGALYFNSTANSMRVWNGSSWADAGSAVNGTSQRVVYTATANQTTFSVVYDAGFVDVYLNGIKLLLATDFTGSSGTTIVLATGATVGDIVDIVSYGAFNLANTYTQAQADARYAPAAGGVLATNAMPKSGGEFTGAVTTNSTIDGRDVAADGVTADAALARTGGTMSGGLGMGANDITSTGKILYSNMYAQTSDLPSASTYHGMFAHVHATGKGYFAHGGAWIELANQTNLSSTTTTANAAQVPPTITGTNVTAVNASYHIASAGGITITLPSSPSAGNYVTIKDGTGAAATTTFTVARNGSNIASSGTDLVFDKNFAQIVMTYINSTIGWSI